MSENGQKPRLDPELAMAKLLIDSETNEPACPLSCSKSVDLSPEQMEELRQAQECLQLLRETQFAMDRNVDTPQTLQNLATTDDFMNSGSTSDSGIFELPDSIGRFRIIEEIGKGGFGIVLKARDELLNRDVALKIPRVETLVSDDSQKRFEREARAAGALSHPAIVPIFESGRIGPASYIAFAFCEGVSLDTWMKMSETTNSELAAKMVAKLADALSHAHSRGVIHRDVKPSNIMISAVQQCGETELLTSLKITDFGLAALTNEDESLTVDGALVGTPAYMSPEQAQGELEGGATIDIYSLGIVLFQLITGDVPFKGKSNLAVLKAITDVPAPSPKRINPDVPDDLAAICLKCLEKKPEYRYESACDLSDDLHRFLSRRPIRARRPSALRRLKLWYERNPFTAILSLLLLASLVIGFVATLHQYRESQANLNFADSNFKQAKATVDELLARAMSVELKTQPAVRKEMLQTVSRFYQQFIGQNQDVPDLDYDFAVSHRNLAKIDREFGKFADGLKKHQAAEALFDKCVDKRSVVGRQLELFGNLIDIGLQLDHLGRLEDSIEAYEGAIPAGHKANGSISRKR